MYTPKHFQENSKAGILRFLQDNGFGQLISQVNGKLFVTHLPFIFNDDGAMLIGHMAKANPQWKEIETQEVLITFLGAHDYISPSWYIEPGVPTWNYEAVHVYGTCKITQNADRVRKIVEDITAKYEAHLPNPWVPDYRSEKLSAIVGLEICVADIQAKLKLSQSRSEEERTVIVKQLQARGSLTLAQAMEKRNLL